jgi:hypothetical protein
MNGYYDNDFYGSYYQNFAYIRWCYSTYTMPSTCLNWGLADFNPDGYSWDTYDLESYMNSVYRYVEIEF